MNPKICKILSVLLCAAMLAGLLVACQQPQLSQPSSTISPSTTTSTAPSTTPTTPTDPEPLPSLPSQPEPLPPATVHTLQQSVSQMPPKPQVDLPNITARDYFIFDTRINDFLYSSSEITKPLYIGSITKVFTTYVALQHLTLETVITVGDELDLVKFDASRVWLNKGDQISVANLVRCALVPSGCDASHVLAASAGRVLLNDQNATGKEAIDAFLVECNRVAKELGMVNTNIATPDGYHDDAHVISIQALAIIGKCCLANEFMAETVACAYVTIRYTGADGTPQTRKFATTNQIINAESSFYQKYAVGLKTGTTGEAGACLLAAYEVDGRYIIVGIFGSKKSLGRYYDALKLFNAYLPYL